MTYQITKPGVAVDVDGVLRAEAWTAPKGYVTDYLSEGPSKRPLPITHHPDLASWLHWMDANFDGWHGSTWEHASHTAHAAIDPTLRSAQRRGWRVIPFRSIHQDRPDLHHPETVDYSLDRDMQQAEWAHSIGSGKHPGIQSWLGQNRPGAWIDDLVTPYQMRWAFERDEYVPTLFLRTDHKVGLTPADMDRLRAFQERAQKWLDARGGSVTYEALSSPVTSS